MNISRYLTLASRRHGPRIAIQSSKRSLTYAELEAGSAACAARLLARGLVPGDVVALQSANCVEVIELMFACFRSGLVFVPIHFKLNKSEVDYILAHSGASLFVSDDPAGFRDHGALGIDDAEFRLIEEGSSNSELLDVDAEQPAWLFYTSGTTGRPKGATLTHGNLDALVLGLLAEIFPATPDDVFLHAGPLSHASGLCSLACIARGVRNVLFPGGNFTAEKFIDVVATEKVTATFMVPTMISRLLDAASAEKERIKSLSTIIYGGAPIALPTLERANSVFGASLVQLYGQGEAPHVLTVLPKEDHQPDSSPSWPSRLTSAGRPCVGVDVKIVDENDQFVSAGMVGEVVARGPIVMRGYWADEEATAAAIRNGWLHTGDLGYFDEHGYLFLTDQKKDLIITGGMNVYSREVEDILAGHPAVREVAVIGVPDSEWGEIVKAFVVPAGPQTASEVELIEFCRARMAPYKKPKVVQFIDALPQGATGKVLKRALKALTKGA